MSLSRNLSRFTGFMCSIRLPHFLRPIIYGAFGKVYGINFSEMKIESLTEFETFNKFFTRELKDGVRTISNPEVHTNLCSPCDGTVLTCGLINQKENTIDCVKGRSYRLDEFMLGHQENSEKETSIEALVQKVKAKGKQLFSMVIYLAPSDYHRYHSPAHFSAFYRRHIPGYLEPVKPAYVNKQKDVFKNNERVNLFGEWIHGFFLMSFVGALNVGSIKLNFDEKVTTNMYEQVDPSDIDRSYCQKTPLAEPM
jgi:phosphatidylserine decarboxylase